MFLFLTIEILCDAIFIFYLLYSIKTSIVGRRHSDFDYIMELFREFALYSKP